MSFKGPTNQRFVYCIIGLVKWDRPYLGLDTFEKLIHESITRRNSRCLCFCYEQTWFLRPDRKDRIILCLRTLDVKPFPCLKLFLGFHHVFVWLLHTVIPEQAFEFASHQRTVLPTTGCNVSIVATRIRDPSPKL